MGENEIIVRKKLLIILILCFVSAAMSAQDTRPRLNRGVYFKLNKSFALYGSLQSAYKSDLDKLYDQYAFGFNYRINKKTSLRPSVSYNYLGSLNKVKAFKIYGLRLSTMIAKSKSLRWVGRVKLEHHSKNQYRYKYRLIPSLVLRTKIIKLDDRMKLNFSAYASSYFIYGGNEISQYNSENEYIGENSPRGFHRYRWGVGSSLRYNNFVLSFYYMVQREFNMFDYSKHKINQVSKKTGKINHKFIDYNAITMSFNVILNWGDMNGLSIIEE